MNEWKHDAQAPATTPAETGEWPLNPLRWTLLKAASGAPASARLGERFSQVAGAVAAAGLAGPLPLSANHRTEDFDCGVELLDALLRKSATEVAAGAEKRLSTRVITCGNAVAGYYSTRRVFAFCEAKPAERIALGLIARGGVDRRWRRPGVADDMFLQMLREAWNVPAAERPAALVGFTVSPAAKRFFRRIGIRPLGDAIHIRGVVVPAADLAAAAAFVIGNARTVP